MDIRNSSNLNYTGDIKIESLIHTELDLRAFFHLASNLHKDMILKDQLIPPYSLYLYYKKNQTTTSYFLTSNKPGTMNNADKVIEDLRNENPHDHYIVITKTWRAADDLIQREMLANGGDLDKLPPDKKKETLIIRGTSKDGTEKLNAIYDVIRMLPADETSLIVDFE